MGGAKDWKPEELGRNPLEEMGSCKSIMWSGGPSVRKGKEKETQASYPGWGVERG